MQSWNVLVEAEIQGVKIQGAITVRAARQESAEKLARQTFINRIRGAGVWAYTEEVDEPYEVEIEGPKDKNGKPTKKKEIKYKKVIRYHAPYWNHVKVIKILEYDSHSLTFPQEELDEAARYDASSSITRPKKRRTSNEAALHKRKKKQVSIEKKEKTLEKTQRVEQNKVDKEKLLKVVEAYFIGDDPKIIKVAASELEQTYQRGRYALFQIKDKG